MYTVIPHFCKKRERKKMYMHQYVHKKVEPNTDNL